MSAVAVDRSNQIKSRYFPQKWQFHFDWFITLRILQLSPKIKQQNEVEIMPFQTVTTERTPCTDIFGMSLSCHSISDHIDSRNDSATDLTLNETDIHPQCPCPVIHTFSRQNAAFWAIKHSQTANSDRATSNTISLTAFPSPLWRYCSANTIRSPIFNLQKSQTPFCVHLTPLCPAKATVEVYSYTTMTVPVKFWQKSAYCHFQSNFNGQNNGLKQWMECGLNSMQWITAMLNCSRKTLW